MRAHRVASAGLPGAAGQGHEIQGVSRRSGNAPFFFTQNFFEKNIFFSRKPLDKIEKVWYNIYTEKKKPKGHREALKELKEPEKEKIMKYKIDQIACAIDFIGEYTPEEVLSEDMSFLFEPEIAYALKEIEQTLCKKYTKDVLSEAVYFMGLNIRYDQKISTESRPEVGEAMKDIAKLVKEK